MAIFRFALSYFFALHRVGIDKNVLFLACTRKMLGSRPWIPREAHARKIFFNYLCKTFPSVNPNGSIDAEEIDVTLYPDLWQETNFIDIGPSDCRRRCRDVEQRRIAVNLASQSLGLIKQALLLRSRALGKLPTFSAECKREIEKGYSREREKRWKGSNENA